MAHKTLYIQQNMGIFVKLFLIDRKRKMYRFLYNNFCCTYLHKIDQW